MRTFCAAQGTLFNVLWRPEWVQSTKGRGYMYAQLIHFAARLKLTQRCKEAIPQ